ncbi:hypothetical protein E5D57_011473 [Metarhizium anisopliae]|nr:hypothetical protein E5D57_011473 [Metarhizium anisopliae]
MHGMGPGPLLFPKPAPDPTHLDPGVAKSGRHANDGIPIGHQLLCASASKVTDVLEYGTAQLGLLEVALGNRMLRSQVDTEHKKSLVLPGSEFRWGERLTANASNVRLICLDENLKY